MIVGEDAFRNNNYHAENVVKERSLRNEAYAITFVNQTMMEPLGRVGRDPGAYDEKKPFGVVAQAAKPYSFTDIENLHAAPIPKWLENYSQPTAEKIPISGKLCGDNRQNNENFTDLMAAAINHVRNEIPVNQQAVVYAQLAERTN